MARKDELTAEDDRSSALPAVRGGGPDDAPSSSGRSAGSRASDGRGEEDPAAATLDRAGVPDLEPEAESPFLRSQKRVPVRRGPLPSKKAAQRVKYGLVAAGGIGAVLLLLGALGHYGRNSWRFRIDSSDQIEIAGTHNVTRAQVLEVFGGDIARNIFSVPLAERKKQLEQIPWVESATVMRFLPNRLKVQIHERTPAAFVQLGNRIALIDSSGVIMDLPQVARSGYSFPVIVGMKENEPLSTRAARMKIFAALLRDLDAGGANYSRDVSEVDLSEPDDVRITVTDGGGEVLIHLGASNYLDRYKIFVAHAQEWRQQFQRLDSVDLRYERQVIVNPH
jgi:cell division protein FtsQ